MRIVASAAILLVCCEAHATDGGYADLVRQVTPSVVTVLVEEQREGAGQQAVERANTASDYDGMRAIVRRLLSGPGSNRESGVDHSVLGSGFIIRTDGLIVTNRHVIAGAHTVKVKLADGRELPAQVIGADSATDIALLKLTAGPLPALQLRSSANISVGEAVIAIGNPFGLGQSVTAGIVSAWGRTLAPFDAKSRRTDAVVEQNGQRLRVMKGAVRTIAESCGLQPPAIEALEVRVSASAAKGYRTLAVARGPETGAPALVGLVSLVDPPRQDAKQLIAELQDLGVAVKMLTGDALPVACEIGQGVGLPNIRRVADLKAAGALTSNKAVDLLAGADGFAGVFPEDKYIVVQHLQAAGHVTGMTGDGVNDAPVLRQAEVGIAVSTATDVAKGAASVVLTEPGLTNIVVLVEQGRTIYQLILTWIINKISRTILKAAFVAIAFV
jgi:magnesium-transporting ATPase (P-type)